MLKIYKYRLPHPLTPRYLSFIGLSADLLTHNKAGLNEAIARHLNQYPTDFCVSWEFLHELTEADLMWHLDTHNGLLMRQSSLSLMGVPVNLHALLEENKLLGVFEIYKDQEEALEMTARRGT